MSKHYRSRRRSKKPSIEPILTRIKEFETELVLSRPLSRDTEVKLSHLFTELKPRSVCTSTQEDPPHAQGSLQGRTQITDRRHTVVSLTGQKKGTRPFGHAKKTVAPKQPNLILAKLQQVYSTQKPLPIYSSDRSTNAKELKRLKKSPTIKGLIGQHSPTFLNCNFRKHHADNDLHINIQADINRHQSELATIRNRLSKLSCMKQKKASEWTNLNFDQYI